MYNCRSCLRTQFTAEEMKKEKYLHSKKRGICKACATEYERNQRLLRLANKKPSDYLNCGDCDRTFSNRNTGNFSGNNQYIKWDVNKVKLRVGCPFCKSDNINKF
jgi:hypothetical protein